RNAASRRRAERVPRRERDADAEGTGALLYEPGGRHDPSHVTNQGAVPGQGDPDIGNLGLPGVESDSVAGEDREPRSANASRVAAAAARQSARAEAEGQGGYDRRG